MNKTCGHCRKLKSLNEFSKDSNTKDGRDNDCKECSSIRSKKYYLDNLEKQRIRKRNYYKTDTGKLNAYKNNKSMFNKHHTKYRARQKLCYAVKTGKLIRKPCEICGEKKTQGHHEDYLKPLSVRWLCDLHHGLIEGRRYLVQ